MRASRLVSLLLQLQSRGGQTAAELARELEVSVRTIHRDVDALSASGVPIYADRGPHGGIRLVDGYRTRLTGMTADEAEALFLSGLPGPAAELGLGTVVAAARLKVLASLPTELRARASRLVERFHLDAAAWYHPDEPVPLLGPLSEAVWESQRIQIGYDRGDKTVDRVLEPLAQSVGETGDLRHVEELVQRGVLEVGVYEQHPHARSRERNRQVAYHHGLAFSRVSARKHDNGRTMAVVAREQ